jgi:hypothetical protein
VQNAKRKISPAGPIAEIRDAKPSYFPGLAADIGEILAN